MQDKFWTPELWCEFLNSYAISEPMLRLKMEQFKSSKSPKKEWEIWLTEDGVEVPIIEGNRLFYVEMFTYKMDAVTFTDRVNVAGIRGKFPQFKYFSTREAAEAYILENKPLLSLNDVKGVCNVSGMMVSAQTDILIEKLTALVKQKLNQ